MTLVLNKDEQMIYDKVISVIPEKMQIHFEGVTKPWDIDEVIVKNLEMIGYKDVIQVYEYNNDFDTYEYKYYFYLKTFMESVGYSDYRKAKDKILRGRKLWSGKELKDKNRPVASEPQVLKLPESLKIDQFEQLTFLDIPSALYVLAIQQRNGKKLDKIVELLYVTGTVSKYITDHLIKFITLQQLKQERQRIEDQEKLILDMKAKEDYAHDLILKANIKRSGLKKNQLIYVLKNPEQGSRYKIGRTNNMDNRIVALRTGSPGIQIIFEDAVYSNKNIEKYIHTMLKENNLDCKYEVSSKEWFWCRDENVLLDLMKNIVDRSNEDYETVDTFNAGMINFVNNNKSPLMIENNKEELYRKVAEAIIKKFKNEKHITKKAVNEEIKNVSEEKIKIENIISIEITVNDQVYLIERVIPEGKTREKITIKIKQ